YADSRYLDVAEVALYNNCLAGIGLDGASFFYPNPLAADDGHAPRSAWFGCACCPSNLARLIPQISGYMYASDDHRLFCGLYGNNSADLNVDNVKVHVDQITDYPFDGVIDLDIKPQRPTEFELTLRIPSWAQSQFVPGELYHFSRPSADWRLTVNGEPVQAKLDRGFAVIRREWKAGDRVRLELPMDVRANTCIDKVEADRHRVAITRGPLLYSAEGIDNGGNVERFYFDGNPDTTRAIVSRMEAGPLAGLPGVELPAHEKTLKATQVRTLKLIPYFAWSNRDRGSMATWIPTDANLARIDFGARENLKFAGVSASHTYEGDTVDAIRMKHTPSSSFDTSIRRWTGWPQRGRPQWVEIDLGKAMRIKSVGVYFYDDHGGVQVPKSWRLSTPDNEYWKPVDIYNTDSCSVL
ncbi:MAG: glycoside hydrolase family 127 protein, partial [Phycisphaerales bacterium]|nr:glycoside hydrolase family 127 protein [Phycisphaerales bacterium]